MAAQELSYPTAVRSDYLKAAEAQDNNLINNYMKKIEVFKKEIKSFLIKLRERQFTKME